MAQTINTNVASLNAQRNLSSSQTSLGTTLQRLSSGLRVNSAKDDAAGLAIAEKMSAQTRGMQAAMRNANDAISLMQTAEGAVGSITDMVQRVRELAVQSASDTITNDDRALLQKEVAQLGEEITRTVEQTKFNGQVVLDGSIGASASIQVGANKDDSITVDFTAIDLSGLAAIAADISTKAGADSALDAIDTAGTGDLDLIAAARADLGAYQNRFESTLKTLQTSFENQSAARGRIMDADFATETANLSRTQILQQAGTAMLAQANSLPQNVLSLLR